MPPTILEATRVDTPFGELHAIARPEDGAVVAAGFSPLPDVIAHLPAGHAQDRIETAGRSPVRVAVKAWADGELDAIDAVPVAVHGSPFFREVWTTLRTVPAGEVVSYQELARMAGRPRAMRAVGTACARNTLGLFVPCHRVIASGGRLGGYGFGGPGIKAALLEHEGLGMADATVTESTRVLQGSTADARPGAAAAAAAAGPGSRTGARVGGAEASVVAQVRRASAGQGAQRPEGQW